MADFAPGITVCVPSIPPREKMLGRALESIEVAGHRLGRDLREEGVSQFKLQVALAIDDEKQGAARTRHAALLEAETEYVAFLDDDDEMLPRHLSALYFAAQEFKADYLWSRFRIQFPDGRTAEGPQFLGAKAFSQWDDANPCQTTITTLVKTELALRAGGFEQFDDTGQLFDGQRRGEDFEFTTRCRGLGGVFRHVPEVTWLWHHHGKNTSGMPSRW